MKTHKNAMVNNPMHIKRIKKMCLKMALHLFKHGYKFVKAQITISSYKEKAWPLVRWVQINRIPLDDIEYSKLFNPQIGMSHGTEHRSEHAVIFAEKIYKELNDPPYDTKKDQRSGDLGMLG